jgi:hypothetical protein
MSDRVLTALDLLIPTPESVRQQLLRVNADRDLLVRLLEVADAYEQRHRPALTPAAVDREEVPGAS